MGKRRRRAWARLLSHAAVVGTCGWLTLLYFLRDEPLRPPPFLGWIPSPALPGLAILLLTTFTVDSVRGLVRAWRDWRSERAPSRDG
ncbi:hypothetical protein ACFQ7A_14195 [Streptomyces sp. NPDC056528]|uniref:hypothetical protein n=1 Tax=Streptomyces sp. NPDC056528 TaxID=3345854 RepID=UPI00369E563A